MEMDRIQDRRLGHQSHRETFDRNAAGKMRNFFFTYTIFLVIFLTNTN